MTATFTMEIPRDALESARMTVAEAKLELAIALFAASRLSLGKAAELAGLPVADFHLHLGSRHPGPHYDSADAQEDQETLATFPRRMIVVAGASPLIALARIERLQLLRTLFGTLLLPEAVWREMVDAGLDKAGAGEVMQAKWIERRVVADLRMVALLRQDLGAGEAEAIVLAQETGADLLLMDERIGRSAAKRLGLRVTGLVGILMEARERGLLADAEAIMNDLHEKAGFWLSDELRRLVVGKP